MVRATFVDENGMRKGAWSKEEDDKLRAFIQRYGYRNWRLLPGHAGLARSGKSCRLRWMNYLKPGLKRGTFSQQEHDLVLKLHASLGKKWSAMALELPGRTDNEIKNYWHGHIAKRSRKGNQAANVFLNEEQAIKLDLFVLESSQIPCEPNITSSQHEEPVSPESGKESESSPAEDETRNFWTEPFTFDTDSCGEKPAEAMDFWPELPPLDTDIYGQFNHPPPFLQEEDLLFTNVHYDDFSSFNHATSLFYYA